MPGRNRAAWAGSLQVWYGSPEPGPFRDTVNIHIKLSSDGRPGQSVARAVAALLGEAPESRRRGARTRPARFSARTILITDEDTARAGRFSQLAHDTATRLGGRM